MTFSRLFALCLVIAAAWPALADSDPFNSIEHVKLANGIQVFLAPSTEATITNVRVDVKVGYGVEDRRNFGVAHLLEHVLFRDKQLKDEMSYLQLIKEAGGEANGGTSRRVTSYYGSIPAAKGEWLLEVIGKMLLSPSINEDYVAKEKSTVELERGRPGPITQALGIHPMEIIQPRYLALPGFWETEFGVDYEDKFTLTQEQLSTQRLTTEKVREFYEGYYHPANMQIFVAGNFDRAKIMAQIESTWAKLPARPNGKTMFEEDKPNPRAKPYRRAQVTERPYVSIGTKFWGATKRDADVLDSYAEYLAHRLMKEIRNKKGQTYTASGHTVYSRGFGYTYVDFQTSKESFDENLALTREMIEKEARGGGLTDEQVRESVTMYLDKYKLTGREADGLMAIASEYAVILEDYGQFASPYAALLSITPEEYRAALKKHYAPDQSYESLYQPNLFFQGDFMLLIAASLIAAFYLLRRSLTKPFVNDRIRWVRNVSYPPLKLVEALGLVLVWYLYCHVHYLLELGTSYVGLISAHVALSYYFENALKVVMLVALAQGVLSFLPRKLMVMDDFLVIKSVSYYSRRVKLSEIASVELRRSWTFPFPLKLWLGRVRYRVFCFSPKIWRKALIVNLADGRSYAFSVSHPEKVLAELQSFVGEKPRLAKEEQAA